MEDDNKLDEIYGEGGETDPSTHTPTKPKVFKGASAIIIVILTLAIAGVFVIGFFVGKGSYSGFETEQPVVDEVYGILRDHYMEDVSREEFETLFAAGFSSVLDKYTGLMYSTPQNITGVYGISMQSDMNSVKTVRYVEKAGVMNGKVQRGDKILEAKFNNREWEDVQHMRTEIFTEKVKDSETMGLKVLREGKVITVSPVAKGMPTVDPYAEYKDTPFAGIGYISLTSFDEGAADDFMRALYKFIKSGNNVLMLDVRNNPGGTNYELAYIVRNFIAHPTGTDQVLKIKTRSGNQKTNAMERRVGVIDREQGGTIVHLVNDYIGDIIEEKTGKKFRLILMANDSSASATEAFIGNIRHYMNDEDYLLLGESAFTFGKGIAQQDFPLKSKKGVTLHVTVGKYYILGKKGTPNENIEETIHGIGYPLDNKGIVPDIKANVFEESIIVEAVKRADAKWNNAKVA